VDAKHVMKLFFHGIYELKNMENSGRSYILNRLHDLSLRYIGYLIGKRLEVLTFVYPH